MSKDREAALSRREREIMDILYARGSATAAEVREAMAEPPTDPAVRATLRTLVEKGHLRHEQDGPRYVYKPTTPPGRARRHALERLLHTFFGGSVEGAMSALLDLEGSRLSDAEREQIRRMIDTAEKEGR
jgi:BlaI family transcriptional regulator, penicillinase repressor